MSKLTKTLASLFAAQEETAPTSTPDADAPTDTTEVTEGAADDEEPADEPEPTADATEPQAPAAESAPAPEAGNTVSLALADYEKLISLASDAKAARAESKALKVKAEQWDNYQAALAGGKPAGDTAGGKPAAETPTSEVAQLRAKHGALMEGIEG